MFLFQLRSLLFKASQTPHIVLWRNREKNLMPAFSSFVRSLDSQVPLQSQGPGDKTIHLLPCVAYRHWCDNHLKHLHYLRAAREALTKKQRSRTPGVLAAARNAGAPIKGIKNIAGLHPTHNGSHGRQTGHTCWMESSGAEELRFLSMS